MISVKSTLVLTTTLVFAGLLALGCQADNLGESTGNVTACDGAYRDVGGYCRLPNGRFAAAICCETDCDGAYRDVHGYCRLPNGHFAAGACCEAACSFDATAVLAQLGIHEIETVFPEVEVCAQAAELGGDVSFEDALAAATESFIIDDDEIESPLALLQNVDPGDDPPCAEGTDSDRVRCYLNRSSSMLAITYRDGEVHGDVYPAENGESVEDNWIFFLRMPELSDHLFWAVVQRYRSFEGGVIVSNYGFN